MDITTQRRFLTGAAGGLLVGTAAAIGWSLSGIDTPSPLSDVGQQGRVQPATPAIVKSQSFEQRMAARPLRAPLYDPPPAPVPTKEQPVPAAPPQPQLDLTLVGTIIEENRSIAILSDASGQFDVKGIGESLELTPPGVTVESIESEQVTLQFQDGESVESVVVQLDRSLKKSGKTPRGNNRRRNR